MIPTNETTNPAGDLEGSTAATPVHDLTTPANLQTPDHPARAWPELAWALQCAAETSIAAGEGVQPGLLSALHWQEAQIETAVLHFQTETDEQFLSHAAEWLLDNFYLAQQSLRQIREDLPPSFYRQLPKLAAGPMHG